MEVRSNQDAAASAGPGASDRYHRTAPWTDGRPVQYYAATRPARAFASDEDQNCRFLPDSAFCAGDGADYRPVRRIAGVIFEQMLQYQTIQPVLWQPVPGHRRRRTVLAC